MKKKKIIWISGIVLLLVISMGAYAYAKSSVSTEVAAVSKGEIRQYIDETAVVQCTDKQTVYVEGSGKITAVNFDTGDRVSKGDTLLQLDTSDLELQLQDADARVAAAKAQLQGTDMSNYADSIELARAGVEQYQVAYDAALRSFGSTKQLYDAGAISTEDYNKSQDALKTAEAALNTAKLQLKDAENGAPDYLKNSYISALEQAVVYRSEIQEKLDRQQLKAPIDGILLEKDVDVNMPAAAGTAAFVIGDVTKLELEADILADDSCRIKVGDEVEISSQALGDNTAKGKVIKIAPDAKEMTSALGVNQRRVPVKIGLIDSVNSLKPGYNADVRIITDVVKDTITVPDTAVFDYQGSSCVLAVENGKAVIRKVGKGIESDDMIQILEGLKPGDKILVNPGNSIREGTKIKPLNSKSI